MKSSQQCDLTFKILLVGDSNVGKTSILLKFTDGGFSESHMTTIGIESKVKYITRRNKKIKLQILDSAGQERFHSITKNYFRGAQGIMFVFDVTEKKSFTNLKEWVKQAKSYSDEFNFQKIIIANKIDLVKNRIVSLEDLKEFAGSVESSYIETSAKTNCNIEEAFTLLIDELLDSGIRPRSQTGQTLVSSPQKKQKKNKENQHCCE